MGTGGVAAGGEKVMDAFLAEFDTAGISNGKVKKNCAAHKVGCRGFCHCRLFGNLR